MKVATVTIELSRDGHCSYSLAAVIEYVSRKMNSDFPTFEAEVVSAKISEKERP